MAFKTLPWLFLGIMSVSIVAGGCAYRPDLAQGNFVEQEACDQLRAGMTKEQVRYVLGTPMLVDPFDANRWYYVHYYRTGWKSPKIQNLVLLFQGNLLADMSGDFKKPPEFGAGMPDYEHVDQEPSLDKIDLTGSLDPIIDTRIPELKK